MIQPGHIVVVSLREPREQMWGVLRVLDDKGVTLEGIAIDTFDSWLQDMAAGGDPHQHMSVLFFPMGRVERILLDRGAVGMLSLSDRTEQRLGRGLASFLAGDA